MPTPHDDVGRHQFIQHCLYLVGANLWESCGEGRQRTTRYGAPDGGQQSAECDDRWPRGISSLRRRGGSNRQLRATPGHRTGHHNLLRVPQTGGAATA